MKSGLKCAVAGKRDIRETTVSAGWAPPLSQYNMNGPTIGNAFPKAGTGLVQDYRTQYPQRLYSVTKTMGLQTDTRSDKEISVDLGRIALGESGKSEVYQLMTKRAPVPHQRLWQQHELVPRAIDREVAESFYRNTMGVYQDCHTLILHTSRISLADGWGGTILTTELN